MKKILFGSAAAICTVVGFSAFKTAKPSPSVAWFTVSGTQAKTNTLLSQSQVAFLQFTKPTTSTCSGTGDLCIVGYSINALTANEKHLATSRSVTSRVLNSITFTKN